MMFEGMLRLPDRAYLQDGDGLHEMARTEFGFGHRDAALAASLRSGALDLSLTAGPGEVMRAYAVWRVQTPEGLRVLGDHWERGYGDLEWRGIVPERVMPWYLLANGGARTHGIGVKTGARALCWWRLSQSALVLCLDVRNGGGGVRLAGRTLAAASVVARRGIAGESPYDAGRAFCRAMCDAPLLPDQPIYGGNNWYYAYGISTQERILADAAFVSSLAASPNRPTMVIDDGWQICRNTDFTGGPWHAGNAAFPDMARLAGDMKDVGVRPGLWIRPLLNCRNFPDSWRLPAGRFREAELGGEYGCFLDPSIPDALAAIGEDIARLRAWGYELIKHDYTTYDLFGRWGLTMGDELMNVGWHFADVSRTTMEIVQGLYAAIRDAAGEATVMGCNTIGHAAAGLFAVQRTGDDTSGVDWSRTRRMGINTLAARGMQHGAFFAADADCVGITERIPWTLNRQWLELVAGSGTPLFVSVDPATATVEQKQAIRTAFDTAAVAQPDFEPLDCLHTTCPIRWRLGGAERVFTWEEEYP